MGEIERPSRFEPPPPPTPIRFEAKLPRVSVAPHPSGCVVSFLSFFWCLKYGVVWVGGVLMDVFGGGQFSGRELDHSIGW